MQMDRLRAIGGGIKAAAMVAIALLEAQAGPNHKLLLERQAEEIVEAEAGLRAASRDLPECADGCLTPSEAVAVAFSAGPDQRVKGRFVLDVRGGGDSNWRAPENLFFLNSERNYRVFGALTLAIKPEAMMQLLNPPRAKTREPIKDGDIIVEAERPQVELNVANMMARFENRRLIIDGEVGLQWIRYNGTPGIEGQRGQGYYQVWIRITSPAQVTILEGAP